MNELELLQELAGIRDARSADRANIRTMLRKCKHGQTLSYQERQTLWSYAVRYGLRGTGH